MGVMLTAADVQAARFSRPPIGKRGYREEDVDEFLESVADALEGRAQMTAEDVDQVAFRKPKAFHRGYDEDQVDGLLDDIATTLRTRRR